MEVHFTGLISSHFETQNNNDQRDNCFVLISMSMTYNLQSPIKMNGPSRQRIPLPLQKVFIGSSQGQEITKPPPGNVAICTFKNILHRHRSKHGEKFGTTIQPNVTKELHKLTIHPPPITDRDDPTSDSNNSSNETVALRSNQDESVDHAPASCSGYSEVMNFDNLYSSPKKIKAKFVQKTLVRIAALR